MATEAEKRLEICREHGLADEFAAYQLIAAGARGQVPRLLQKRLNASVLAKLGYDLPGMRKLGYGDADLERLGYLTGPDLPSKSSGGAGGGNRDAQPRAGAPELAAGHHATPDEIREMVASGWGASQLRGGGFQCASFADGGMPDRRP